MICMYIKAFIAVYKLLENDLICAVWDNHKETSSDDCINKSGHIKIEVVSIVLGVNDLKTKT